MKRCKDYAVVVSTPTTSRTAAADSRLTQFGSGSDPQAVSQNGSTAGVLRSFAIGSDGTLSGVYSNGRSKPIAQLSVANFANPKGLIAAGDNHFRRSNATGEALMGTPGVGGRGELNAGTLEICERLAPRSLVLAKTLENLSLCRRDVGDLAGAEALQRRAIELKHALAPGTHTEGAAWINIGNLALSRGDVAAAEAFAANGTGAEPDSEIAVTLPSERPAAFASTAARSFASSTAFASACRYSSSASERESEGP